MGGLAEGCGRENMLGERGGGKKRQKNFSNLLRQARLAEIHSSFNPHHLPPLCLIHASVKDF